MTTTYPNSVYPLGIDNYMPRLIDNVDEVIANHQNTGYEAIENIEAKLGIRVTYGDSGYRVCKKHNNAGI